MSRNSLPHTSLFNCTTTFFSSTPLSNTSLSRFKSSISLTVEEKLSTPLWSPKHAKTSLVAAAPETVGEVEGKLLNILAPFLKPDQCEEWPRDTVILQPTHWQDQRRNPCARELGGYFAVSGWTRRMCTWLMHDWCKDCIYPGLCSVLSAVTQRWLHAQQLSAWGVLHHYTKSKSIEAILYVLLYHEI